MGARHSSMEEELGLLPQRAHCGDSSNQGGTRPPNGIEGAESTDENRLRPESEFERDVEHGNGTGGIHGLGSDPDLTSTRPLSIVHGPGSEHGSGNGASGDYDVVDGSSTVQGQDKCGPCLPTQEATEQAASQESRPQTKNGAQGETSRTQSYDLICRTPEKSFNSPENNSTYEDPPSLHLLKIKSFPTNSKQSPEVDIIATLQKRPPLDFKGRLPNFSSNSNVKERTHHQISKKRTHSKMDSTKKQSFQASAPGEDLHQPKKAKVAERADWDYSSDEDRYPEDTPPSPMDPVADDSASVDMTAANATDEPPKRKAKGDYKPNAKESKVPEKAHKNMVDRFNTLARASKYDALYNALVENLVDLDQKKAIIAAAYKKWDELMQKGIKNDTNPQEMGIYYRTSEKPDFGLSQEGKIHIQRRSNKHTNSNSQTSPQVRAQSVQTKAHGNDLLSRDAEHMPEGRAGETILGVYKFEYPIYIACNTQKLRGNEIRDHATQLPETFTDREAANAKLLELTQYENFEGDLAAVTRRNIFEYTPIKLLKAEITLVTGEERVFWVDRHLVDLRDLTKRQRSSRKWSAKRPTLPHFIVECEFMTRSTTEEPQEPKAPKEPRESSDDEEEEEDDIYLAEQVVGDYTGDIELERLPLETFTDRRLANDHAGALFLRYSAVNEEIRTPLDDFWWVNNAVTVHREAEKKAKEKDGRYVAEFYSMDMNTRLGFDWMRVAVYAVDDVTGPLNI